MSNDDRLRADEWEVRVVPRRDAVHLVKLFHYSKGAASIAVACHGLFCIADGVLGWAYGAAVWMTPTKTVQQQVGGDDWQGVLALSRFVVAPEVPVNGASFLLGRAMKLLDRDRWPVLVTYADRRLGHTGAIYRATNWRYDGEAQLSAGNVWLDANGGQHSRQKRSDGLSLTREQCRKRGWEPAPAGTKLRFVHDARSG